MRDGLDLRLVPSGLAAYVAATAVVVMTPGHAAVLGSVAVLGVGAIAVLSRRRHGAVGGQIALVLAVLAVVLLAGAAQLAARQAGGLGALAAERAVVRIVGTVSSDAVPIASALPGAPARYRLTVSAELASAHGVSAPVAAPVMILAGPEWADTVYGSRVAVSGRLSPAQRGSRPVALLAAAGAPIVLADPPAGLALAARIRSGLAAVASRLPGDAGALLPGVAVGDTSQLPTDLSDAMRIAGLTHLTAISGAHFALVGAAVLACAGAIRLPRAWRVLAVVVVLAGLITLVHPGASVVRAAAMGALGVGGLVVGRPARALPALGAGVVVLLVADPWLAREIGFVLSVLATAGLVLLAKPLAARWSGTGAPVAYALAVPMAAQCVCAPVIVLLNPAVSTYAVPANLLADPAVAPATVLGLLSALVAPWWSTGATVLADVAGAGCWWIATVARTAAALPCAQVAWAPGPRGALLLAVATVAALALVLRRRAAHADGLASGEPVGPGRDRGASGAWHRCVRGSLVAVLPGAIREAIDLPTGQQDVECRCRGARARVGRGAARPRRARARI
jgi:competence protein ComEC